MPVAKVVLDWYRVALPAGELLTPSLDHAQHASSGDAPDSHKVKRWISSCDQCSWEGNPSEDKAGAEEQLGAHIGIAHTVAVADHDGALIADDELVG